MPNYFYTDPKGQKQGPVSGTQLKELITRGIVKPDTLMETPTGQQGLARQIPGLFSAQPFDQVSFFYFDRANNRQGPVSRQELEALATQGIIGPLTLIETPAGEKAPAEQIVGVVIKSLFKPTIWQRVRPATHATGSWLGFIFKFAAYLGTAFAGIWTLAITSKLCCLAAVFLGIASIVVVLTFRIVLSLLFG